MLDLSTNASTRYNLEQIDKASRRAPTSRAKCSLTPDGLPQPAIR